MPVYSHNVTQPLSINQILYSNGMALCGLLFTNTACANEVSASKQASKQAHLRHLVAQISTLCGASKHRVLCISKL